MGPAALPTPLQTMCSLIPLVTLGVSHPCSRVPASQCPLAWGRGTDFSPQSQPLPFEFSLTEFSLETITCGDNGPCHLKQAPRPPCLHLPHIPSFPVEPHPGLPCPGQLSPLGHAGLGPTGRVGPPLRNIAPLLMQ